MTAPVLLDPETARRWAEETAKSEKTKLTHLLELRGFLEDAPTRKHRAQLKRDACTPLRVSMSDLDASLWRISGYSDNDLARWAYHGFGLSHFQRAKECYAVAGHESPTALLNEAQEVGGKDGEPMTADELYDFAMGALPSNGHEQKAANLYAGFSRWSVRVASRLGWDDDKRADFEREFAALWKRYVNL